MNGKRNFLWNVEKTFPPKKMKPERFSRHIFFPLIFLADKHDFPVTTEFTMKRMLGKNNPFHLFFSTVLDTQIMQGDFNSPQ